MKKREASFTTYFRHWLKSERADWLGSAAFELKQTITDNLPFMAVKQHQIDALLAAKNRFSFKIPDDSIGVKPFDLFYLKNAHGFVAIKYPKFFCLIDVEVFVLESKRSERRSLTSKRACEIAISITINK